MGIEDEEVVVLHARAHAQNPLRSIVIITTHHDGGTQCVKVQVELIDFLQELTPSAHMDQFAWDVVELIDAQCNLKGANPGLRANEVLGLILHLHQCLLHLLQGGHPVVLYVRLLQNNPGGECLHRPVATAPTTVICPITAIMIVE
eukprot:g47021.t1